MKVGLLLNRFLASRAITSTLKKLVSYEVTPIEPREIANTNILSFQAIVVAQIPSLSFLASVLSKTPSDCQLIYISDHTSLPDRPTLVPWSEDQFDVSGELLPDYGNSSEIYAAERMLLLGGSNKFWTILRTAIVEGPSDTDPRHTRWFVDRILQNSRIVLPDDDEQPYRHVSTRDLAQAVQTVLHNPKFSRKIIHVVSNGTLTPTSHARMVAEALGRKINIRYVPAPKWDALSIPRPMAGRRGSALLAPSPLLRESGWTPTLPARFLRNLALEIAEQPRYVLAEQLRKERSLITAPLLSSLQKSESDLQAGWELQSRANGNVPIEIVEVPPVAGDWETIAIALGEDVERRVVALRQVGIERAIAAPMLLERKKTRRKTHGITYRKLVRESLIDDSNIFPVPAKLGTSALMAIPLARLLASWHKTLPEGDVWVLGRGIEALFAYRIAMEEQRNTRVFGAKNEATGQPGIPGIEVLKGAKGRPAVVVNVSGVAELEHLALGKLANGGVLISPYIPAAPLTNKQTYRPIDDLPIEPYLGQALKKLAQWSQDTRLSEFLYLVPQFAVEDAFAAPAFRLPVCIQCNYPTQKKNGT